MQNNNRSGQQMKLKKQIPQCCRHRADEKPGKLGRGQVHAAENPLYSHGDRALTVHFEKKMDFRGGRSAAFFPDQIFIKGEDQLKIMLPQGILPVIAECGGKKRLFLLNLCKFFLQTVKDRGPAPHMFKGAGEELVEIPVDQVIFIKKIPVKGLAGDAAALCDLADSDRIDRSCLHAFLHGCGETVFCFFPLHGRRAGFDH